MRNEILRLERVTQIEQGVTLLNDFSIHIFEGEIMGLVCINAHGKEALVRLLCQNVPIHYGYVYFQDILVNNYEHSSMAMNRVAVIEQRSRLIEHLTVADNIFVLRRGFKKYLISPRVLETQLRQFTAGLDVEIDAGELVGNLSFFQKCVVELLRAVVSGVKLVVLRDISNFIAAADLIKMHELFRRYAANGISFLYICSHHEESFQICDRIALVEDGRVRKVLDQKEFRDDTIMHFAYARGFGGAAPARRPAPEHPGVLDFCDVTAGNLQRMRFTVEKGECVLLLDTDNSALTDLMRLMGQANSPLTGDILVGGESWSKNARRLQREICFIGEDPIQSVLFHEMNYLDNLCFWLERRQPLLWMIPKIRKSVVREYEPLIGADIHAPDIDALSPFSLYNLIYYKAHLYRPKVLFITQPFSGADMYLRRHIIELIGLLKKQGIAVVILAVSVADSLMVADRLLLIERGRLRREYHSGEFSSYRAGQ